MTPSSGAFTSSRSLRATRLGVFAAATLIGACSKGSSPSSPTINATPSNSDWSALATQLVGIGIDAFQQGVVSPSSTSTVSTLRWPGAFGTLASVAVPATTKTWSRGYFCCGVSSTTGVMVTGSIQMQAGGTVATLDETIFANGQSDWKASTNAPNWMLQLPTGGMRITCSLATSGGTVQPSQTFKLAGALTYAAANQTQSTSIDAQLSFSDYQAGTGGVATGQIGPVNANGQSVSTPIPSSPCSLPREGCPTSPPPNGNAPCTPYPLCPS